MTDNPIKTARDGHVLTVTLDRPRQTPSISPQAGSWVMCLPRFATTPTCGWPS